MTDNTTDLLKQLFDICNEFQEQSKTTCNQISLNKSTNEKLNELCRKLKRINSGCCESECESPGSNESDFKEEIISLENKENVMKPYVLSDVYYRLEKMRNDGLL